MEELYKGFITLDATDQVLDELYDGGKTATWENKHPFYPNMYVELRSTATDKHTALGKVDATGQYIRRIQSCLVDKLEPKNREQVFALNALTDPNIPVVVLTGSAGTGKTIIALAAALYQLGNNSYSRVIITRPMSQVGKYQLGTLPGDMNEKFNPYLLNYLTNLEQFVGGKKNIEHLMEQCKIDAIPLQLFRGASFNNCLVIADEMQVCNHQETLTVGTRMGEGSKLILMGDLNQRDENISKVKTGMYKLMNDSKMKESSLVAAIELQKCERSETARLFSLVFEEH